MAKEQSKNILPKVVDFITELFTTIKTKSETELEKIKTKVVSYVVIYGLFLMAILFLLIGFVKYLSELGMWSEGIAFMIVGSILIVILAAYSLIKGS